MHMANIILICNKYKGLAFWFYHIYLWDKAAEYFDRGVAIDWSVLDAESLHAALAHNSCTNFCEFFHSWYHSSAKCPFNIREKETYTEKFPEQRVSIRDRGKAYYKGKEICNKFNFAFCSSGKNCTYLHCCKICQKFDHSMNKCPNHPGN